MRDRAIDLTAILGPDFLDDPRTVATIYGEEAPDQDDDLCPVTGDICVVDMGDPLVCVNCERRLEP